MGFIEIELLKNKKRPLYFFLPSIIPFLILITILLKPFVITANTSLTYTEPTS